MNYLLMGMLIGSSMTFPDLTLEMIVVIVMSLMLTGICAGLVLLAIGDRL